ncbi:PREDICTED: heat shock 70 kDa protein 12A-like [Cyprinodon variegatus]|uniref:heat shock 70 kDa protein 12A-like n=1 Tax=Cyprinodon variegatus TaxID=28743 RepID=UPI000742579D|nr:PREDICTED: heat shock 70 kDa protein 12A-like [Cyprinodon variegatus]
MPRERGRIQPVGCQQYEVDTAQGVPDAVAPEDREQLERRQKNPKSKAKARVKDILRLNNQEIRGPKSFQREIHNGDRKQFQAGLVAADDTGKVMFINEAEAALAWCLNHPSDDLIAQNSPARPPGPTDAGTSCSDPPGQVAVHFDAEETIVLMETQTGDGNQRRNPATETSDGKRYIVVNCGETIEFNVYGFLDGRAVGKMYEIFNDNLGGRSVDIKFFTFLWMIFQELWKEYEENFPNEVQEMMINFLRVKHLDEEVWIRCPENLKEQAAKKKDIERFFDSVEGASWDNRGIRISREILRSLYREIQVGLPAYINHMLGKDFNIGSIVLVGGLAQSQILRQSITEEFGSDYKVLCPLRPQEVILKGAVELAINPKLVSFPKKAAGRFKCFS